MFEAIDVVLPIGVRRLVVNLLYECCVLRVFLRRIRPSNNHRDSTEGVLYHELWL